MDKIVYKREKLDSPQEIVETFSPRTTEERKSEKTDKIEDEIQENLVNLGIDKSNHNFEYNSEFYNKVLPVVNIASDSNDQNDSNF